MTELASTIPLSKISATPGDHECPRAVDVDEPLIEAFRSWAQWQCGLASMQGRPADDLEWTSALDVVARIERAIAASTPQGPLGFCLKVYVAVHREAGAPPRGPGAAVAPPCGPGQTPEAEILVGIMADAIAIAPALMELTGARGLA